jgi:hypothetical protein
LLASTISAVAQKSKNVQEEHWRVSRLICAGLAIKLAIRRDENDEGNTCLARGRSKTLAGKMY